ncbi:sensor domain-containing diguanylate cyclase [Leptospira barantonii]|uniref:Sensor domain-containing diguanylate cyclase n=1 Tax=Leptospira barantonii TaxID=2023184 RepID=A0A5F2B631_9LEPT|nr:GGDEF domain-containing protein [Leptospira barantonii]TGM01144.1 sensor domain-containing diguanylate cyclase [Leptospira barantonii]
MYPYGSVCFVSDVRLIDRFGKDRPIECTASLIHMEDGVTLGAVLVFRDVTERKVTEECVRYLAYHDPLTGLPNRTLLFERFKKNIEIERPKRKEYTMSFLFIDIDDFKKVNDTMGHSTGDKLLQEFSDRMKAIVREDDIIVRLSGDEFVIILNDLANTSDAEKVVRKIFSSLKKPFSIEDFTISLSLSVGISVYPKDSMDIDQLIRFADSAMYRSKLKGKNTYAFYSLESDVKVV